MFLVMSRLHYFLQKQIFPAKCILVSRISFLKFIFPLHFGKSPIKLKSFYNTDSFVLPESGHPSERKRIAVLINLCLIPSGLSFREILTLAYVSRDSYKWITSACLLRHKSGLIIATCAGWRLFWNATCIFLMHIWPCLLWGGKERMEQNKFETRFPKFCFANVKGNSEHLYFPFIVTQFHGILHHLKARTRLVVLRCYWKNLEKWSCTVIEIKSIWLLKYFLHVFLFFF